MSSAELSSFSAHASSSSIDPRRLQEPAFNPTSSEEHDSFNDSIDQSFLSSYQSMKNSSSSSPSAMGTSGDYSSEYDAHTDFPMMEEDFLDQALAPYAGNLDVDGSVLPSVEEFRSSPATSHNENASSPTQSDTKHCDGPAFLSSQMAPTVPPRSPMRSGTPQISISTDLGHLQSSHEIETHPFALGRQDSTPINANPSPSIAVGMWNSTTMHEIHTSSNAMVDRVDNGYFPSQNSSATAIPTVPNISGYTSPACGDDENGRGGIDPNQRSTEEVFNFRDQQKEAEKEHRLSIVEGWMARDCQLHHLVDTAAYVDRELSVLSQQHRSPSTTSSPHSPYYNPRDASPEDGEDSNNIRPLSPTLGAPTVNQAKEGQVYINHNASMIDERDMELLTLNTGTRRFENDGPVSQAIVTPSHEGTTANYAIEQYRRAADNFSLLSRRATWGTTSMGDTDIEVGRKENLLKRLSFKKEGEGGEKKPGFFDRAVALARKTSQSSTANKLKRNRSDAGISSGSILASHQRTSSTSLVPPPAPSRSERRRSMSPAVPRLETSMLMPSHHPYHSRRASASNASPTSSIGDFVRQIRSRSRSKSDTNRGSGIAAQWQREGGPPVVTPSARDDGKRESISAQGDSDAEGDDDYEEELRRDENADSLAPNLRLEIEPTSDGFKRNILLLNPDIKPYLVDRFAHQQSARYKGLLKKRVDHEIAWQNGTCPSGPKFCHKMGGQAYPLVPKTKGRNSRVPSSIDESSDSNPENKLGPENFPAGIPMPPAERFPAELECPYCFVVKKFQKPSDWTKHIQEDIAPFTCTWSGCKDARSFKRKADYVRHENEKHRHIESWNCDIDDCAHLCHRKDNFQAHLVREHRMAEPKARNKAEIQKAMGYDAQFWGIVDRCHQKSSAEATNEPCKFCGKSFQTFKKLSGHEAKHMEQISLPIIHLVACSQIDSNTIISPIGPPPLSQQPDTPVGTTFGASPYSQGLSSNHMSPGSEYDQYPNPSVAALQNLDIEYNRSQFQPNYGVATKVGAQKQGFGMAGATKPMPILGDRYNASPPIQHAHSRSYGETSSLAQHLDQFTMENQVQYVNDALRSMSRSYRSSADPSSPFDYPVTNSPFLGIVGATMSMPMTTAAHPANFGMPTAAPRSQFCMAIAANSNQMIAPVLGTMGLDYDGISQQPNFTQNDLGQTQYDGMEMHRSHSDSNMMPGIHHHQQQYQAGLQQGHQYRQSLGGHPPQQQQGLHPQQGGRPRSTSGGNQRLGGMMPQQYMRST